MQIFSKHYIFSLANPFYRLKKLPIKQTIRKTILRMLTRSHNALLNVRYLLAHGHDVDLL
jgi:pyruvate/oxaloacetate carboxyltransferase